MADFIIRKRRDFVFAMEDAPDKTFVIPALSGLSFDDIEQLRQAEAEKDFVKRGELIRDFVLKFVPELEELGTSGMEYLEIYNAYVLAMGRNKLGESQASQDS